MRHMGAEAEHGARAPVIIAAGGTGGHLFPAEALAQELKRRGRKIVLITDTRGRAFADAFPADEIIGVSAATFAGKGLFGRLAAIGAIISGIGDARRHLRRLMPHAVVGFGGYPSFPAMAAAILARAPSCIHEQNAVLGRVNRLMAPMVSVIASSFPILKGVSKGARQRVVVTGNPVRDAVRARAGAPYPLPGHLGPLQLLVFGGSQGANVFSELVPQALAMLDPHLKGRLNVVQQARPESGDAVKAAYAAAGIAAEVAPFFKDLPERMARAHLVIARGGAGTVCELAAIGRPALIVPLPTAMDDHQTVNASFLAQVGAAIAVSQKTLTAESLCAELAALFAQPERLVAAADAARRLGRPDATRALADLIENLSVRRQRPTSLLFSESAS